MTKNRQKKSAMLNTASTNMRQNLDNLQWPCSEQIHSTNVTTGTNCKYRSCRHTERIIDNRSLTTNYMVVAYSFVNQFLLRSEKMRKNERS